MSSPAQDARTRDLREPPNAVAIEREPQRTHRVTVSGISVLLVVLAVAGLTNKAELDRLHALNEVLLKALQPRSVIISDTHDFGQYHEGYDANSTDEEALASNGHASAADSNNYAEEASEDDRSGELIIPSSDVDDKGQPMYHDFTEEGSGSEDLEASTMKTSKQSRFSPSRYRSRSKHRKAPLRNNRPSYSPAAIASQNATSTHAASGQGTNNARKNNFEGVHDAEDSLASEAATCGTGTLPPCRGWTWDCDMGRINENAANLTHWRLVDVGKQQLHRMFINDTSCDINELSHAHVTQCLKGKHIMIMGDSISRYQYYNLAQFLESSYWHPLVVPASEHSRGWEGRYNGMYEGVNARLHGHEICDCGRTDNLTIENHYYFHPRLGIRLTFVWRTGINNITFHPLGAMGERCQHDAFSRQRGGMSNASSSDDDVSDGEDATGCSQGVCRPGGCAQADGYHSMNDMGGVEHLVSQLRPDALVMNVGLWMPRINDPGSVWRIAALGRRLRKEHPRLLLVWKTTTWMAPGKAQWHHKNPPKLLRAAGWRVSDASGVTRAIRDRAARQGPAAFYRDQVHFQPHIYRALNELLLGDLCSAKIQWP